MKINFSKVSRSVLSVVVALSMLFSVAMPAIAETVRDYDHIHGSDDGINFVVLGDSMANGYGTEGYYPAQYEYAGAGKGDYKITEYGAFVYVGENNGNFAITEDFLNAWQLNEGVDADHLAAIADLEKEYEKWETINNAIAGGSSEAQTKMAAIKAEIADIQLAIKHNANRWGYLMESPDAWPTLVVNALANAGYDVDFKNLSISGMRPTELLYLLDDAFEGDEYTQKVFAPGAGLGDGVPQEHRFCRAVGCPCGYNNPGDDYTKYEDYHYDNTNCTNGYNTVKGDYAKYIGNADLIAIHLGTNTFGTLLTAKLGAVAMGGDSHYADKSLKDVLEDEESIAIYEEYEAKIIEALSEQLGSTELLDMLKPYIDILAYSVATFMRDYAASYDIIKELNPNADIVIVGVSNPLTNMTITVDENTVIDLEAVFDVVVDSMNTFLAGYTNENAYFAELQNIDLMVDALARDEINPVYEAKFISSLSDFVGGAALVDLMTAIRNGVTPLEYAMPNIVAGVKAQLASNGFSVDEKTTEAVIEYALAEEDKSEEIIWLLKNIQANLVAAGYDVNETEAKAVLSYALTGDVADIMWILSSATLMEAGINDVTALITAFDDMDAAIEVYGKDAVLTDPGYASLYNGRADIESNIITPLQNAQVLVKDTLVPGIKDGCKTGEETVAEAIAAYEAAKASVVKAAGDTDIALATFAGLLSGEGDIMSTIAADLNSPAAQDVLQAFARLMLAEGMGIHPSEKGHEQIADAVVNAVKTEYTGLDHIMAELEKVADLIAEYYDEAYAYGYAYAKDNGYIDIAINAIQIANTEIDRAYAFIDSLDLSAELKAELAEEIDLAKVILKDIEDILANDEIDQLDAEALGALFDLLSKLEAALYNIADIAGVAYADVYAYLAEEWETVWKPAIEQAVSEIADAARAFIDAKLDEAREMLMDVIAKLEAKIELYIDAANAELQAVIAELKALITDLRDAIGEEIDSVVGSAMDKIDAAMGKLNAAVEKINAVIDQIKAFNAKVEAALAKLAELKAEIVELNAKVAEKLAQLAELKAQLIEKYEELRDAAADAKQEIEETIEKLEAAIETVKTEIENLKAMIAQIKAEIEAVKAEIEELRANICALVEDVTLCIKTVKAELEAVIAEVTAIYENIAEFIDGAVGVANDIKAKVEAIKNAIETIKAEIVDEFNTVLYRIELMINGIKATIETVETAIEFFMSGIEDVKAMIDEIRAMIDEIKATIEALDANIREDIKAAVALLKAVIEGLKGTLEEIKAELGELKGIAAEQLKIALKNIKTTIETIKLVANELKAALKDATVTVDEIKAIVNKVVENTEKIKEYAAFVKLVLEYVVDGATNGYFTVEEDSFYLAFGDSVAASDSYVDILAEMIGIDYENLAEAGQTVAGALAALEENRALIADADFITVNFGNAAVTEFMFSQMNAVISGVEPAEMDWDALLGEDAIYAERAIATLTAALAEQGLDTEVLGANLAELITLGVESYVYAYTAQMVLYPELTDAIAEIAPEALIVVVGTYNDLEGVTFDVDGAKIDIGAYIDYTVELANLKALYYAMSTENNVVFVDASDVETIFEADIAAGAYDTVNLLTYFTAVMNGDLAPSEAGHAYIVEQILNAVEIEAYEPEDTTPEDTTPEDTTPDETTPDGGDVTTPDGGDVTTPDGGETSTAPSDSGDETTPEDTPDETTPDDTPNDTTPTEPGQDEPVEGLPVGAIVGISVAAVAVVAAGGFCLYWFVFKKRIV